MPHANQIEARGTVVEILRDGACRIQLPNGHRCIARAEKNAPAAALGDTLPIAFHPYDLTRARIL